MNKFKQNIISLYGKKGQKWIDNLPTLVNETASQFNLKNLIPADCMNFNYIAFGNLNSKPIVLKLTLDEEALFREVHYLNTTENYGSLKVLAYEKNMMIMEQAVPGTQLKELFPDNNKETTTIFCNLVKQLHSAPIPHNNTFKNIKELLKILDKDLDIPKDILSKACSLRDNLLQTTKQEVLLHGDLHHENILKHNDKWKAIDPKGFIGDPAFEIAGYLYNPIPELPEHPNAQEIVKKRIALCSQALNIPQQRIHGWMYVKTVLCWAWTLEGPCNITCWNKIIDIIHS